MTTTDKHLIVAGFWPMQFLYMHVGNHMHTFLLGIWVEIELPHQREHDTKLLFKVVLPIYTLPAVCETSNFTTSLPTLGIFSLFLY